MKKAGWVMATVSVASILVVSVILLPVHPPQLQAADQDPVCERINTLRDTAQVAGMQNRLLMAHVIGLDKATGMRAEAHKTLRYAQEWKRVETASLLLLRNELKKMARREGVTLPGVQR